jgi:UDP-N-acetylmuramoylalanine--D-glutamate ligase
VARTLAGFGGLAHRVQLVGERAGVRFYDDSKATNPHATAGALAGFEHAVLIAGGRNKGLDLSVLRAHAPRLRAVVAIGDAAGEVEDAFRGAVPVVRAASMRDAVVAASMHAQPGDAVLLSPACASFDWYESYAARGDDFAREVASLIEAACSNGGVS